MKQFLDKLNQGIVILDLNGMIQFCNHIFLSELLYLEEELIGKPIQEVVNINAENFQWDISYLLYAIKNALPLELIRKDEERLSVKMECAKQHWEWGEAYFLIMDRRQDEVAYKEAYKEAFERYRQLRQQQQVFMRLSTDLTGIADENFHILEISSGVHSVLGWDQEEFMTFDVKNIIHPRDREEIRETHHRLDHSDKVVKLTCRFLCKDGSYRWLEITLQYNKNSKVYFFIGKDVTMEKSIESERLAYQEAKQLEMVKNEFFSNISHEIRTPINVIMSMFQLINYDEQFLSEEQKKVKDILKMDKRRRIIKQNMYRLLRLMNNLLDITRINSGYFKPKLVNCNVVSVIEEITMSVVTFIKCKTFHITFDTDVEELIMACDIEMMERIMLNLLSNTVKYTHSGGNILVELKLQHNKLIILVQDDGIGIPEEECEKIFSYFRQVDDLFTRKCEGVGVGLAITKAFVEMHEGSIRVESQVNKGSTFIIELPIIVVGNGAVEATKMPYKMQADKCKIEFSDIYNVPDSKD